MGSVYARCHVGFIELFDRKFCDSQEACVTRQCVGCRSGARVHRIHLWANGNWPWAGSLRKLVSEIMINIHIYVEHNTKWQGTEICLFC